MNIAEYQEGCKETAIYRDKLPESVKLDPILDAWHGVAYCTGKLNGEAGEIAELVFKAQRDDACVISAERYELLFGEMGDVCWYIAMLCNELGLKLEDVMDYNLAKLRSRRERDVLSGSGSER
jgi:NTP pyrophosphatase (non-canonical NTP hydrolase)